jgi:hypothetical protein
MPWKPPRLKERRLVLPKDLSKISEPLLDALAQLEAAKKIAEDLGELVPSEDIIASLEESITQVRKILDRRC